MIKLFYISLIFSSFLFAQVEQSGNDVSGFSRNFDIDVVNHPTDSSTKTRVDVFIRIPYSNIQFIRDQNHFTGKYTVTVTFSDENKQNVILEKFWNEKIEAKEFSEAISNKNFNYSYRSFELDPQKYFMRCEVYDKDSKKSSVFQSVITVRKFDSPVNISDLIFITDKIPKQDGFQYIPLVSNKITNNDSLLSFVYEIYSDKNRPVNIEYSILDGNSTVLSTEIKDTELKKGANNIDDQLKFSKIILGAHTLKVVVRDLDWEVLATLAKPFVSGIYGFPSSIVDLDKAIEQMTYIASGSIIDEINEGKSFEEKLYRYKSFWKSKDPSKGSEENELLTEYYRRIEYANANFKNYIEGWRTDMGMIYIVLGPPNYVERHPFDIDSKPYEVWDYYDINKRFVFVDHTGFGDYRLLNQQYGDWYRYRP
jgi:GWxTD domain-containing protein